MAQNSYKWELTADRREVRGADGGGAECSGEPWFTKWLIQASSYRDPEQGDFVAQRPHTRVAPSSDLPSRWIAAVLGPDYRQLAEWAARPPLHRRR